jgi:hypothetical protein
VPITNEQRLSTRPLLESTLFVQPLRQRHAGASARATFQPAPYPKEVTMAEEGDVLTNLDADSVGGNGADNQPIAGILQQYVKDLSVENPKAPKASSGQSSRRWTSSSISARARSTRK